MASGLWKNGYKKGCMRKGAYQQGEQKEKKGNTENEVEGQNEGVYG